MIRSPLAGSFVLSPNIGPRRLERPVDMIILHYTGMTSAEAACAWLCNSESGVSCHYLVDESGFITQMVGEEMRAWHAGISCWHGETDTNSRSIGIEIHNGGHMLGYTDFPEPQIQAVIALCKDIGSRHDIPPQQVLAHSDVAPGRKIDPGEKFDWQLLHRHGIGHWVIPDDSTESMLESGAEGDAVRSLQELLITYGYGLHATGHYDADTTRVISAFQRHFRPSHINGSADAGTIATLKRLVDAIGGDQLLRQSANKPERSASSSG